MRKARLSRFLLVAAVVAACSGAPEDDVENVHTDDVGADDMRVYEIHSADSRIDPLVDPLVDPITGLKTTGDWEIVRNNCIGCHSAQLITQQRGTAVQWSGLIRWMQETQNLWQFDPDTEARIVSYLAENYPPRADSRREAIPRELMPPNPYSKDRASNQ